MCQQSIKKVAMRRDCEKEHEGDEMIPRAGRRGVIETVAHLGAWRAGRWRSNRPPRPRGRCRTASSACRRPSRRGASFVNYIQSADLTGNKTPDERRARRSDDRAPVPARCLRRSRASPFRPVRRPGLASRELARPVRPAGRYRSILLGLSLFSRRFRGREGAWVQQPTRIAKNRVDETSRRKIDLGSRFVRKNVFASYGLLVFKKAKWRKKLRRA